MKNCEFILHARLNIYVRILLCSSMTDLLWKKKDLVDPLFCMLMWQVSLHILFAESPMEGSALTYFRMNQSPTIGRCEASPTDGEGIEMETNFRVSCLSWYDTVSAASSE